MNNRGFAASPIAGRVAVRASRPRPDLDPEMDAVVAGIWEAELLLRPRLFNGPVFSVDQISPDRIDGHWTEYRRIVAQLRRPDLARALAVQPLAVAGVLVCDHGIVFGRRPDDAAYQPGLWQLAPAGNVDSHAADGDRVDLEHALLLELGEELGLATTDVTVGGAICAVRHPAVGIIDIAITLSSRMSETEIRRAHAAGGDGEYPALDIVSTDRLIGFLAHHGDQVAPQTRLFLQAAGALAR